MEGHNCAQRKQQRVARPFCLTALYSGAPKPHCFDLSVMHLWTNPPLALSHTICLRKMLHHATSIDDDELQTASYKRRERRIQMTLTSFYYTAYLAFPGKHVADRQGDLILFETAKKTLCEWSCLPAPLHSLCWESPVLHRIWYHPCAVQIPAFSWQELYCIIAARKADYCEEKIPQKEGFFALPIATINER
jgi:hypothetical protein